MEGVYRTRVGYTGGSLENPTYHNLGDHTEAFQVDYDPALLSYEDLLEIFWDNHNPTGKAWSRQYRAAIFTHNQDQENLALESKAALENMLGQKVTTEIVSLEKFYLAEDYHQKYYLQARPELADELIAYYPDFRDFVESTAAARINGYIGGYGNALRLAEEIERFGLSPRSRGMLKKFVY